MLTKKILLLITAATATLGGCMSYGPNSAYYKSLVARPLYGQVNNLSRPISSICESKQVQKSPFCSDQNDYVWAGALVGQHGLGLLHKASVAVPKSAGVETGDIIEFHITDIDHPWAVFDQIAAKKSSQTTDSPCRWVGSHFSTGGVVCDGWRWNKNYPPAAD